VCPIILASDKTQLSHFTSDTSAYPVYLSIGNVCKDQRRKPKEHAMLLLTYLPTQKVTGLVSRTQRSIAERQLFHRCMTDILQPLVAAGRDGVDMTCADGYVRHVYPILAAYIADYPEQCLVTCCRLQRCPKCKVHPNDKGDLGVADKRYQSDVQRFLAQNFTSARSVTDFDRRCKEEGLVPIAEPFWAALPHTDIFSCITPDGLHELHKGVFKDHLTSWCLDLVGLHELDARFAVTPPHHGLRTFSKGVSNLSQTTGTEHKHMEKIFVPLLLGNAGRCTPTAQRAAKALVDFIFLSHLSAPTDETLSRLEALLEEFHAHKHAFLAADSCKAFHTIPKLHKLQHYTTTIRALGAPDNFDTELPERLHIDYAKVAYRAGNRKDYINHMCTWLDRKERVFKFYGYLRWCARRDLATGIVTPNTPTLPTTHVHTLAVVAPYPGLNSVEMAEKFHVPNMATSLGRYLDQTFPRALWRPDSNLRVDCFVRLEVTLPCLPGSKEPTRNVIRCRPANERPTRGPSALPQFDTVLIHTGATGRCQGTPTGRMQGARKTLSAHMIHAPRRHGKPGRRLTHEASPHGSPRTWQTERQAVHAPGRTPGAAAMRPLERMPMRRTRRKTLGKT
jgi:hypothetical protein